VQRYIEQLIEEFEISKSRVPNKKEWIDRLNATSSKQYNENNSFEAYTDPINEKKIAEIIGIASNNFPPEKRLTDEQLDTLFTEIEKLFLSWHFILDFPDAVPIRLRYCMVHKLMNNKFIFMAEGNVHLDFCGGLCEYCEILKYCPSGSENVED